MASGGFIADEFFGFWIHLQRIPRATCPDDVDLVCFQMGSMRSNVPIIPFVILNTSRISSDALVSEAVGNVPV